MTLKRRVAILAGGSADEDGFTIIEVLVAALILALGASAVLMTLVAGIRNVQRGKDTQVAVKVAQRELEKVRSLGFAEVSLEALPQATPSEPDSPNSRVSVTGTEFNLARRGAADWAPVCSSITDPCLTATAGRVVAGPTDSCVDGEENGKFNVGAVEGQVYCFVTMVPDVSCPEAEPLCVKRVAVAVWLDKKPNASTRPSYYELQSDFVDSAG